jgi:hypothetical protein
MAVRITDDTMTLRLGDRVAYSRSRIRRRVGVSVRDGEVLLSPQVMARCETAAEQATAAATSIMAPPGNMGSMR